MSFLERVTDPFQKYFSDKEPVDLTDCYDVIEFAKTAYFETLMAYLERGSDEPLKVGGDLAMVRSAERINTFKEIRAHLKKQVKEAQEIIDRETIGG